MINNKIILLPYMRMGNNFTNIKKQNFYKILFRIYLNNLA